MPTDGATVGENLCRLCLTDDGVVCSIFGTESSNLAQKIYECTSIEVEDVEGVPSAICEVCKSKLIICSQFISQSLRTDKEIRQLYAKHFAQYEKNKHGGTSPVDCEQIELIDFIPCDEEILPNTSSEIISLEDVEQDELFIEVTEEMVPEEHKFLLGKNVEQTLASETVIEEMPAEQETNIPDKKLDMKNEPPLSIACKELSLNGVKKDTKLLNGILLQGNKNNEEIITENEKTQSINKYKKECPICGILQQNLTQHMIVHTGQKKHVCEYCNKAFAQRGNLNVHQRIHTGNKPHKCDQCDKRFGDPSALKLHKVCHSEDNKYHCNICNSTFKYPHSLQSHIRSHNNDRRHSCDYCGKAFVTSSVLKKHIRQHTGERPYQCKVCPKAFSSSGNLSVHQKMHNKSKLKPQEPSKSFICNLCDLGFSHKSKLKKHMKTHTE